MADQKDTRYPLRNIPDDVYKILWREQARLKAKHKKKQYSLALTIYSIVREHERMKIEKQCPE
jgi:hypothetical protein